MKNIKYLLAFLIVILFTSSCDSDYSETGRGLLYAAGLVAGVLVDRAIANERKRESFLGIIAGIATMGVFALAAAYVPGDLANFLGTGFTIIGTIVLFVYLFKK